MNDIKIVIIYGRVYSKRKPRREMYEPQCSNKVEGVVECGLLRVVLECEDSGVDEHPPSDDAKADEAVASRTFKQVQYFSRVKILQNHGLC